MVQDFLHKVLYLCDGDVSFRNLEGEQGDWLEGEEIENTDERQFWDLEVAHLDMDLIGNNIITHNNPYQTCMAMTWYI